MIVHKFYLIFFCFLFILTFLSQGDAAISKEQIQIIRQLPVQPDVQDDLINNYDRIRDWIYVTTIAQPTPGRPSLRGESTECATCRLVINTYIQLMRAFPVNYEWIIELGKALGCFLTDLVDAMHPDVCRGALELFKGDLHYIVTQNSALQAVDVCTVILGKEANCGGNVTSEFFNWTIDIKGDKPPLKEIPYLPEDTPTVKILQLTDIHLDLDYAVGKNTKCGKPMCCQLWEDDGADSESSAGPHGDYKCDTPESAVMDLFEHSAGLENYEYEFVMMTGDIPPHNVWNTTLQGNLDHYKTTNDKLLQLFPPEGGIPIYPVMGNHEPHPCNLFPPKSVWGVSNFDKSWMYDAFAEAYAGHIKDPQALQQFKETGYYTVMHKDTNLRIIVINTNLGYTLNFWLYYDMIDPQGQLQWLADTLQDAEDAGERVWILGHGPPGGSSTWTVWSENYEKIALRYEEIIMGQFFGHTHNDEIEIFYNVQGDDARPANSLYVGASATALTNVNPAFKVYFADPESWEVVDHETWMYSLAEANAKPDEPMPWKRLFKAREAFGLKSLRPSDLDDLMYRMLFDDELFAKYQRYYHTDSPWMNSCDGNANCKMNYICDAVIANTNDYTHCERFKRFLDKEAPTGTGSRQATGIALFTMAILTHFMYSNGIA